MWRLVTVLWSCALALSASTTSFAQQSANAANAGVQTARAPELDLRGFEVLALVGYGTSTASAGVLDLEPYAATFGLDLGYTWAFGFRIGAYVDYGMGRTVQQTVEPEGTGPVELTSDGTAINTGASIGFDVPLAPLVLRYTVNLGATWMQRDINTDLRGVLGALGQREDSQVTFHLAPGLTLLWPLGLFECGVGMRYLVPTSGLVPTGIRGELLLGVKL